MLRRANYRGLELAKYLVKAKQSDESLPRPIVELLWKSSDGSTQRKQLPWRRASTDAALAEYIDDYIELVNNGYRPAGFESPPIPHCARVLYRGQAIAEWHSSPKRPPESLVTGAPPLGSGGIPKQHPNAPCSEQLLVPMQSSPCASSDSASIENNDPANVARLEQGKPVAKAGHLVESQSRELAR